MLFRIKFRLLTEVNVAKKFVYSVREGQELLLNRSFKPIGGEREKPCFRLSVKNGAAYVNAARDGAAINGRPLDRLLAIRPGDILTFDSQSCEIHECPYKTTSATQAPAEERTEFINIASPHVLSEQGNRSHWPAIAMLGSGAVGLVAGAFFFFNHTSSVVEAPVVTPPVTTTETFPAVAAEVPAAPVAPVANDKPATREPASSVAAVAAVVETRPDPKTSGAYGDGKVELMAAIERNDVEKVKTLVNSGVSADFTLDSLGRTPLIQAAASGRRNIANFLLSKRANLNATDFAGNSALMWSIMNKQKNTARYLLEAGADTTLKREDGETAVTLAKKSGDRSLAKAVARAFARRDHANRAVAQAKKSKQ